MYNYACSLGNLCHSANILKRNKLKLCSYPFDWIFTNSKNVIHCIEDNFKIFLNKSYYIDIHKKNKCGHKFYHNDMFFHKDPRNDKDYNYYIRCVERFNNLLQCKEQKLFIMILTNQTIFDIKIKNDIIEFNNKFKNYTSNYTLLVIYHLPNKIRNVHEFIYKDNIHFLELHTISVSNGIAFENDNDNIYLDNVINSTYKFNLQ